MKSKNDNQVKVSNGDIVKRKYVLYILIAILIVSSSILVLRIGYYTLGERDFRVFGEVAERR